MSPPCALPVPSATMRPPSPVEYRIANDCFSRKSRLFLRSQQNSVKEPAADGFVSSAPTAFDQMLITLAPCGRT